jgi:branched-subunit amino acid permease
MTGLAGHGIIDQTVQYMLVSRGVVLVACLRFSTSLYNKIGNWFRQRYPGLSRAAAVVLNTLLFALTLAVMM